MCFINVSGILLQCGDVGVVVGVAGMRQHWQLPMLLCFPTWERGFL